MMKVGANRFPSLNEFILGITFNSLLLEPQKDARMNNLPQMFPFYVLRFFKWFFVLFYFIYFVASSHSRN